MEAVVLVVAAVAVVVVEVIVVVVVLVVDCSLSLVDLPVPFAAAAVVVVVVVAALPPDQSVPKHKKNTGLANFTKIQPLNTEALIKRKNLKQRVGVWFRF